MRLQTKGDPKVTRIRVVMQSILVNFSKNQIVAKMAIGSPEVTDLAGSEGVHGPYL